MTKNNTAVEIVNCGIQELMTSLVVDSKVGLFVEDEIMNVQVKAQPIEPYLKDVIMVRRKRIVCPHAKLEIKLAEGKVVCENCGTEWK